MSAFHANNLHQEFWSSCLSLRFGLVRNAVCVLILRFWTTIFRWKRLPSALHPTRQIETLEENGRASQIERARAQFKVQNTQLVRLKTLEDDGLARLKELGHKVSAKPISHKLSAQIPTKRGLKIEVKMTGRNARAQFKVRNNKFSK